MLLRIAARVEFASLVLLLANLATAHLPAVARLLGPIHGCAYLFVIGATLQATKEIKTRLLALIPGIGGLLAGRRLIWEKSQLTWERTSEAPDQSTTP